MKTFFQLFIILFTSFAVAQAPPIQWQKTIGGTHADTALSILQTTDGGFIFEGQTSSNNGNVSGNHGNEDVWVVKLNNTGNVSWQKTLGGTGSDMIHLQGIQQTNDGGYIVAAFTNSNDGDVSGNHGSFDFWIVKLNNVGDISWKKTLGGTGQDEAHSIKQTTDGGYIVAGSTPSNDGDVSGNHGGVDAWVVKLDNIGNISWQKALGGTQDDYAESIQQTTDGGYIFSGATLSGNVGGADAWVVKLDDLGNVSWEYTFGGVSADEALSIEQTTDGGYIFAGDTLSTEGDISLNHGYYDVWIVKLTALGNISWQKTYGGTQYDDAYSIKQTNDGGFVFIGLTVSTDGDVVANHIAEYWIVKLTSTGNISWQKAIGGTDLDYGTCIGLTSDGGYIASGFGVSNDGDVSGNHGEGDAWIVKLGPDLGTESFGNENAFVVYPNPATSILNIKNSNNAAIENIAITDVLGKKVFQTNKSITSINVADFQKGLYFIEIASEGKIECIKFVKK